MSVNHQAAAFRVHLLHGNGNPELAKTIAKILGVEITDCQVSTKPSGEIYCKVPLEVAGGDVYIVQPGTANPATGIDVNTALFEMLFLIRRAKLCRAARITCICPFYPYARQDRKTSLRCPLSAAAVAQFLESSGVDRILSMDLHAAQIQGSFVGRATLDDLPFHREFGEYISKLPWFKPDDTVVVSPDAGGVARAKKLAESLGIARIVTILKRRAKAGVVDSMQTVGEVGNLNCIIIDDMIDTGGTLCKAVQYLKQLGAIRVVACITHGIMTHPCIDNINKTPELEQIVISDTIPHSHDKDTCPKLVVLPTAPILAKAILAIHSELSLGTAFANNFDWAGEVKTVTEKVHHEDM
jgi:ribose-phosphate pyrophosphokinase